MCSATCPNCKADLPPQEVIDGWCETCGKKLPAFVRTAATASGRTTAAGAGDASRGDDRAARDGLCEVCQRIRPGVARCCLKVTGQAIAATGAVTRRWVNVRCACCAACYRKARGLQRLRYATLAVMFGVPAVMVGVSPLLDQLERQSGVPRSVIGGLALGGLLLTVLIWVLSPVYIRFQTRRRLRALLPPAMDERLKALVGVRGWGWKHYVTAVRDVPRGERFVELSGV
jgi:hypothetical protein